MKKRLLVSGLFVLMFVIFGCATRVSDTIQEQTPDSLQEQASEVAQEQIPEVQEQKSDSLTNETIPEEVIEKESSFEDTRCSRTFSPKFSTGPYYNGPLFDAHFHMPIPLDYSKIAEGHGAISDPILGKDVTLEEILCFFDKEEVRGSIGFYITDEAFLEESLEVARNINEQSSGRISLFLMPVGFKAETLEGVQKSNVGVFKGYGEIAFYFEKLKGVSPNDPNFLEIYNIAGKNSLVVMMHPDLNQKSDIEKVLQSNPDVNFLLHGFEIEDSITGLMDKYPNVYFSVDSAVLYAMQGLFINGPREQFVSRFERDFDIILNSKVNKWKTAIEKHPDRFMWGTDRGVKWHFDEEISVLFEEFARAFIGRLDPIVQEKYAYRNAERLLQG